MPYSGRTSARTGDSAGLEALGYDTSALREDRAYELSSRQAQLAAAQASAAKAAAEESVYSAADEMRLTAKFKGGPAMWDNDVRTWTQYTYGMTPEQLYYVQMKNADSDYSYDDLAKDTDIYNYEDVVGILASLGASEQILSEDEWRRQIYRSGVGGETEYKKYLKSKLDKYLNN